ncbi:MAG: MATE family efflux transporter [Defluviitaleaceae bacterium]|nr:MATE family efflux transporter [Defluviitaleaceae bacterium]MCL2262131.1 MATE family efflux transporter [Defluviitaleaceae bacterium]
MEKIASKPTMAHLLKFTLPTILSTLIMNTFGIVDGIFVSRLIDPMALSAVNIVFPFMSFVMAFGFMMGVGGNALVAKKIGEGREKEGRENFSLITLVSLVGAVAISVAAIFFPEVILNILGADDYVRPVAMEYMQPMLFFLPAAVLGMVFQQFLITAGKAHYGAVMSFAGGILSAVLNYVFIYVLDMGIGGAAIATSVGWIIPAVVGLVYFSFNRSGALHFVSPRLDFAALGRSCVNGSSEMVAMLSVSITTILMNNILMYLDDGGAAAVGASAIMFGGMGIFAALFMGYAQGVAPIISYNYGKGDTRNLKKAYSNSLRLIGLLSVIASVAAFLLADLLIKIYGVPVNTPMHDMARTGLMFLAAGFIFMGFNSFGSMFFTALNNGVVSSVLALFNTLIFVVITLAALPPLFGLTGAWAATPAAEVLSIAMTVFFLRVMKKKYGYS